MAKTLLELIDAAERHVRSILLERREPELQGFFHLVAPEGEPDALCIADWQNDIQKQLVILEVKAIARKMHAVAAVYCGEVWMVKRKANAPLRFDEPPSQSRDRIEAVSVIATDGSETKLRLLQMIRDKPGGRIIALVEDPGPQTLSGRLVDGLITKE
jgi:hypothetical protein